MDVPRSLGLQFRVAVDGSKEVEPSPPEVPFPNSSEWPDLSPDEAKEILRTLRTAKS